MSGTPVNLSTPRGYEAMQHLRNLSPPNLRSAIKVRLSRSSLVRHVPRLAGQVVGERCPAVPVNNMTEKCWPTYVANLC